MFSSSEKVLSASEILLLLRSTPDTLKPRSPRMYQPVPNSTEVSSTSSSTYLSAASDAPAERDMATRATAAVAARRARRMVLRSRPMAELLTR